MLVAPQGAPLIENRSPRTKRTAFGKGEIVRSLRSLVRESWFVFLFAAVRPFAK
jgi:hypothetical protein